MQCDGIIYERKNKAPEKKNFEELVADIEKMDIPLEFYSVILNDKLIQKENGYSQKDNTFMHGTPDYIIKY
ncbi:hypothetical protein ACQCVB_02240 [Fictibacillus phosphorivorans]|uniref:hypothetical protein n=1 Tax=Fictibacillus phosphorivorans TaxID=1221500 RepID=UPI003CE9D13F